MRVASASLVLASIHLILTGGNRKKAAIDSRYFPILKPK